MNGRVYDPVLGRFLSADAFVQDAGDSQAHNRYCYVSNNPLGFTDPSGYFKFRDLLPGGSANFGVKWLGASLGLNTWAYVLTPSIERKYGAQVMGIGVGVVATVFSWNPAIGGAAAGAASAFYGSLLNGNSVESAFRSGAIGGCVGAVSGYLTGQIGNTFGAYGQYGVSGEIARAGLHGAVSGGVTEAMGGEFRHGFYAGAAGSIFAGATNFGGDDMGSVMARTAVAAVVGGTASALGGGKFANGAITAAFQHMFNAEFHREEYTVDDAIKDGISGALQGAAAFIDGVIPFGNPLENQLHLYDSSKYGLSYSQGIGEGTRDVELFLAGGVIGGSSRVQAATGGLKQWVRIGESYSHAAGQTTRLSIRWGASPRYANAIGNGTLRTWNQLLRIGRIEGPGWRFADPGHLHLLK